MISCRRAARFALVHSCIGAFSTAAWFALVHFCIGAFSTAALSAETIDRVLAIVAGQLITLSDVTAARELGLDGAASQTRAADPVRAVLNTLIDRELVLAEVERYAPSEPLPEGPAISSLRPAGAMRISVPSRRNPSKSACRARHRRSNRGRWMKCGSSRRCPPCPCGAIDRHTRSFRMRNSCPCLGRSTTIC